LRHSPITQAIFAELGLYKKEGYDANFYAGKILHEAGVPVVYKSDHPVTNASEEGDPEKRALAN
jgi:imidazolonepropionase-like amidohydrolase